MAPPSQHPDVPGNALSADCGAQDGPLTDRLSLPVSPAWADRLRRVRQEPRPQPERAFVVPLGSAHYEGQSHRVTDTAGVRDLVELARQRPLSWVGFDFEYRFDRPGVFLKKWKGKDLYWHDPHTCVPLLLGLCLVESGPDGIRLYVFVIDCRGREILSPLAKLFRLPLLFVGHNLQAELICLWRLGLPTPGQVWDTWVAEKARMLGLQHARYKQGREKAEAREEAEAETELKTDLAATCARYGIRHPFDAGKERLQKSFLTHPDDAPFTDEQMDYNGADAETVARILPAQTQAVLAQGCLKHLVDVEMPWMVTNARIIWNGVRVDPGRCQSLIDACKRHQENIGSELQGLGLDNVNSHPQMLAFFRGQGMLEAFRVRGGYSFDDDQLEAAEGRHPAIAKIRLLRKIRRLLSDKALTGELVGADGRLHPEHRQLGAESGRNTMRWPNIGGIGRALRPVVVPEEGHCIGEVDLSQIEVGIAAAVYNDPDLIAMFNARDVYTRMARSYFAAELPPEAGDIPDPEFKKRFAGLRARMKVFTLATIYNITPHGLALRLNITTEQAAQEQARFLRMFPALSQALREASEYGLIRGCAYICSGLRRWRGVGGAATAWEVNWLRNTPVQGSAGVVFKVAGNRLYRRYQHYGAKLILPMHDAYVFEAPVQHLQTVASITAEVLKSAVQEYFPVLDPQVDVNIDRPESWNKDGHANSLERWVEDPARAF